MRDTPAGHRSTDGPGPPGAPDERMTAADAAADNELAELFLRAARRIHRHQSAKLAPLGLTPAQARALRVIADAEGALRMVDLADRLGIVPRSVTTLVDALEAAGLATRAPDPANRRSLLVQPTGEGRAVRARMAGMRREAVSEVLAPLSADQRAALRDLLAVVDDAAPYHRRGHGDRAPSRESA